MEEQIYHQFYDIEDTHWWFATRRRILVAYLRHRLHTSPPPKLLDVGCGTGAILADASRYFDAYGMDASPLAIEFCRKRGLSKLFLGNLDAFPGPEKFDIITLLDVIEHIDDDLSVLRQASGRLNEGGSILVTVPAYPWLWSSLDEVAHHKRRYTRRTLAAVVRKAGFRIDHLTYFNTLLFPVAVFRRLFARATDNRGEDDFLVPAKPVNAALHHIFGIEQYTLPHTTLPFGLSLLCWATRDSP